MRRLLVAPSFLAALLAVGVAARAQAPAGGEFVVNTLTTGYQSFASVARAPGGAFVVAWWSNDEAMEVRAQRFDRSGARAGEELLVGSGGYVPSVSVGPKGEFVVAWERYPYDAPSNRDIRARRFDALGRSLGDELQVNAYSTGFHAFPRVAVGGRGDFVVVWLSDGPSGYGVDAQRFDAAGQRLGSEFRVNTGTVRRATNYWDRSAAAVAAGGDGRFVVAWAGYDAGDGSGSAVMAQRYDPAGAPLGGNFVVNVWTYRSQLHPDVSYAADGSFVAAYVDTGSYPYRILGRRYMPDGTALAEHPLDTTNSISIVTVASDAVGNFMIARLAYDNGLRSFARRFRADGSPRGPAFRLDTEPAASYSLRVNPFQPMVASDEVGNIVGIWDRVTSGMALRDVYAGRQGGLHAEALAVDPAGNGVWEPGERVPLEPRWFNASSVSQSIGGYLTNLAGPAGPAYTIDQPTAVYPPISDSASVPCLVCYEVSVSAPATRPATHWDATAVEKLTPDTQGQTKVWTLHVGQSFTDVPVTNPFYRFVETLLHKGVTGGCTSTAYCPATVTTRDQMAVFVLMAKEGAGYAPPACATPVFGDVPASSTFCRFVEELARRGVVSGCGNGNYCPGDQVTRDQMAIFTLRTLDVALSPPACGTPMFADVPASSPYCRWIEELARRGVVSGCGGGNYCPGGSVTREQMGVFLSATFGLTLYGV